MMKVMVIMIYGNLFLIIMVMVEGDGDDDSKGGGDDDGISWLHHARQHHQNDCRGLKNEPKWCFLR